MLYGYAYSSSRSPAKIHLTCFGVYNNFSCFFIIPTSVSIFYCMQCVVLHFDVVYSNCYAKYWKAWPDIIAIRNDTYRNYRNNFWAIVIESQFQKAWSRDHHGTSITWLNILLQRYLVCKKITSRSFITLIIYNVCRLWIRVSGNMKIITDLL